MIYVEGSTTAATDSQPAGKDDPDYPGDDVGVGGKVSGLYAGGGFIVLDLDGEVTKVAAGEAIDFYVDFEKKDSMLAQNENQISILGKSDSYISLYDQFKWMDKMSFEFYIQPRNTE